MSKIPDEAYSAKIELDQNSVFRLCNSLNAWQYPMRADGYEVVALYLYRAQGMISLLFKENQKLKKMLESSQHHGQ